jgi:hypothetical protein
MQGTGTGRARKGLLGGMVVALACIHRRSLNLALICFSAWLLIGFAGPRRAQADVTAVSGDAYGYFTSVGFFGGGPTTKGPSPTATLPAGGSASPITATAPTGSAAYGPTTVFTSGPIAISTQGTTGPAGSVTSATTIQSVDVSALFTAGGVSSSCTAGRDLSGTTTVTGGTLQTDSGEDSDADGDYTDPGEHPPVTVALPGNPAPNTTYNGHIHIAASQENFQFVFNEQVLTAGSITVNIAHERFLGPTAIGDAYFGHAACGITGTPAVVPTGPTGRRASALKKCKKKKSKKARKKCKKKARRLPV